MPGGTATRPSGWADVAKHLVALVLNRADIGVVKALANRFRFANLWKVDR